MSAPKIDPLQTAPTVARSRGVSRARVLWVTKFAICAGLIGWIVSSVDMDAVATAISGADPWLIFIALLMQVLGAAIMALRWGYLLAVKDVTPGFPYLLRSTVSSFFFRQFMPSLVGGDAIRSYDAWRAGADPGFTALSLVADRLFGLLALILFVAIAGVSMNHLLVQIPGLWIWTGAALAVVGGLLAFLLFPGRLPMPRRTPGKILRLVSAIRTFGDAHGIVLPCFLLSILLQMNVVTFYWVLSESLGLGMSYWAFYAIVPIAIFVMMVPLSINAIGIREAAFIFLLGLWGVDETHALAFAWIEFGTILLAGLLGGIVYMLRRDHSTALVSPEPEEVQNGRG